MGLGKFVLFGFLVVVACSSENTNRVATSSDSGPADTGLDDGGTPDTGLADAPAETADLCSEPFCEGTQPQCCVCMPKSCAAAFHACACSQECRGLVTCLNDCSNSTCGDACYPKFPTGAVLFQDFSDCAAQNCQTECF